MPKFDIDNYVDVQERINRFWEEHPDGAIRTNLMSPPDDFTQCRYKAEVFKDRDRTSPDAIGWAFELAGGNGANFSSHEENCETSAIGRALANMGYAKDRNDRPSAQEMGKVNRAHDGGGQAEWQRNPAPQQGGNPDLASQPQKNKIAVDMKRLNISPQQLFEDYLQPLGVMDVDELTKRQASQVIDKMNSN